MKKRIAYLSVLLLVVGVSFAIAAYTTILNPGHGGETGVWIQNTNGQEDYLQNLVNDLSTLDCDETINFDGYQSIPINFWGHTADQIKITIRGVDTTLQEAINNQWLAKDNPLCSFSVTPTSITGPFHDASQIEIFSLRGGEKSLQQAIDAGDFFDRCECTSPSIWLGSRSMGNNAQNKGSNLLKVSTTDGSILQSYTICNIGGIYSSIGPLTDLTTPPCPTNPTNNGKWGVGNEDLSTGGEHNGFIAQNLDDKEIWYIVGKGVAHYKEENGQLTLQKYCTQPNGIYSVTLDAAGDAWITTSLSPGGNRKIEIKKISRADNNCNNIQNIILASDSFNTMDDVPSPDSAYVRLALTNSGDAWVYYPRTITINHRLFYIRNPQSSLTIETKLIYANLLYAIDLISDSSGNAYLSGSQGFNSALGGTVYLVNKYPPSSPHDQTEKYRKVDSSSTPYGLFGLAIDSNQKVWVCSNNLIRINDLTINAPSAGVCSGETFQPRLAYVGIENSGEVVTVNSFSNSFCTHDSNGANQNCMCNQLPVGRLIGTGDFTGMNRNVAFSIL